MAPIVTCTGDHDLFKKLHPLIAKGLLRETVEWKRSYGRPSRQINVETNFVPFNPDIIPGSDEWSLVDRPFFHTFWTDCDMDNYKLTVKEEIVEWLAVLKEKESPDWLIIVIVSDDSRVKSRILRNSVYDKVKSDFCSRFQDRCIMLCEPLRSDVHSSESWSLVLARMRQLLLDSYTRCVDQFEEHMRAERERRTDPKWSFCSYFMLQEELAFTYEVLGLFEDALVQYDELDALFTQFVLNHAAGDNARWLLDFAQHPATKWDGLCLSPALNIAKRQRIRHGDASLIDLRNYLFSRQCQLLLQLKRPVEMCQRAIPFMHNCIKEIGILKISLPKGAIDCWVFLSCLELLNVCTTPSNNPDSPTAGPPVEAYSIHIANLWDYARAKLWSVAEACNLLPCDERSVSDVVVDSGHTQHLLTVVASVTGDLEPLNRLRNALSSKDAFYRHYLELAELSMGTFKHIGRIRTARLIGKDLAYFYLLNGEPHKAEGFLVDVVKMYKSEGWEMLADHARLDLARCLKDSSQTAKYSRTCMHIASSHILPRDVRLHHQSEIMRLADNAFDIPLSVRCQPVFNISNVELTSYSFVINQPISVTVHLMCNLVEQITVDSISISLTVSSPASLDQIRVLQRQTSQTSQNSQRSRQSSGSSAAGANVLDLYNRAHEAIRQSSTPLDLVEYIEYNKFDREKAVTCGIVCQSARSLRRLDSIPTTVRERVIARHGDWDCAFTASDCVLQSGSNSVCLTTTLTTVGNYSLAQLCIRRGGIDFLKSLTSDCVSFTVTSDAASIQLVPVHSPLIGGIPQQLELVLRPGSCKSQEEFCVSCSDGLSLVGECLSTDGKVTLPEDASQGHELRLPVTVFSSLGDCKNAESQCHEVSVQCVKGQHTVRQSLVFTRPFTLTHSLHTAYHRKYLRITVVGLVDAVVRVSDCLLTVDNTDSVSAVSLNNIDHNLIVANGQTLSLVWELNVCSSDAPLHCTCHIKYQPQLPHAVTDSYDCSYSFVLENYKTLYVIKSSLDPSNSNQVLDVGVSYPLTVEIKPVPDAPIPSNVCYEISSPDHVWELSGDCSGLVAFSNNSFKTCLSVKPLSAGYLYLPTVQLLQRAGSLSEASESHLLPVSSSQVHNAFASQRVSVVQSTVAPVHKQAGHRHAVTAV